MEKIRLKNQKEINMEGGCRENYFEIVVQNYDEMKEIYENLTDENLERIEVVNDGGIVCAVLENKHLTTERRFEEIADTGNLRLKINLQDINVYEKQTAQNTANIDYLVMMAEM